MSEKAMRIGDKQVADEQGEIGDVVTKNSKQMIRELGIRSLWHQRRVSPDPDWFTDSDESDEASLALFRCRSGKWHFPDDDYMAVMASHPEEAPALWCDHFIDDCSCLLSFDELLWAKMADNLKRNRLTPSQIRYHHWFHIQSDPLPVNKNPLDETKVTTEQLKPIHNWFCYGEPSPFPGMFI